MNVDETGCARFAVLTVSSDGDGSEPTGDITEPSWPLVDEGSMP